MRKDLAAGSSEPAGWLGSSAASPQKVPTEPVREELRAVEAALASLNPTPSGVDRDRMMYLAGRASAEKVSLAGLRPRASWLWPCATAATAILAVTFAALWLAGGGRPVAERDAQSPPPQIEQQRQEEILPLAPPTEVTPDRKRFRTDYLRLRRLVLAEGVDGLPQPAPVLPSDAEPSWWRSGDRQALQQVLDG